MVTNFGKELRKIRINHDERLLDMAAKLGVSSSFISAIEVGKKYPPVGFEKKVCERYTLSEVEYQQLHVAADSVRRSFSLEPKTPEAKGMVGMLARRIKELSPETVARIQELLNSEENNDG